MFKVKQTSKLLFDTCSYLYTYKAFSANPNTYYYCQHT